MAEGVIGLPPDSTGKQLRTQTGGPFGAHMEVHVLADADGTLAPVSTLAKDGTDATAVTAPAGGAGIRGWLSGIYQRLGGTLAVSGPVTDTQLRATPLPVSGTVTVSDGSGPLTVDGTVTTAFANGLTTGTLTSTSGAGSTVVHSVPDGHSSDTITLGAFSPSSQVVFECSDDGVNWAATNMRRNTTPDVNESYSQIENNPVGTSNVQIWKGTVGGVRYIRVRCMTLAGGDTSISVQIDTSPGVGGTFLLGNPPSVSDYYTSGTLTGVGSTVECRVSGMGSFAALFSGQWTGKIQVESTIDGATWRAINVLLPSATGGSFANSVTGTGVAGQILQVRGGAGGLRSVRLRADTDYVATTAATGTIRAGAGSSGMYLMAPAPIAGLDSAQTAVVTVGTTAVQLDPTALAARSSVEVKYPSTGTGKVYVGFTSAVTSATGRELVPGEAWALDVRASVPLWAVASVAAQTVSLTELA